MEIGERAGELKFLFRDPDAQVHRRLARLITGRLDRTGLIARG
jgi:hypothetical protein